MTEQYHYDDDDDDDDEDGFRRATKSKVRSASVCFSSTRSDRDRRHSVRAADAECFDARFTSTTNSSPPFTPTAAAAVATATSDHREVKHFRKRGRPACRSQSVRVSGGKSLPRRARPLDRDGDTDVDTDPDAGRGASTWSRTAAISDPKLYGHDSGSEICAPFPSWRPGPSCGRQSNSNSNTNSNSIHHSQCHSHGGGGGDGNCRKCTNAAVVTACSDVPAAKTRHRHQHQHQHQPVPKNDTRAADENSYRLRSFSFTAKGLVNRGDSFKKRHGRRSSVSAAKYKASGGEEIDDTTSATETTTNSAPSAASACADSGLNDEASGSGGIAGASTSTYNVSVMGATGVGKTSLISQFMTSECINAYDRDRDRDEPCQQTQTVSILLNGEESELRFHELKPTKVLRHKYAADAFLVMYSVVDKSTFQYAETELVRLQDCNALHTRPAILVANKIDLARSRTVSSQDGKCLACTFRVKHLEISVGINHNVDELLVGILHQIRLKKQRCDCKQQTAAAAAAAATATASIAETATAHRWYKNRAVIRATMKARQMFTWMFGREDSKFKNCENLHTL